MKESLVINSIEDYAIFMLDHDAHILSWNKGARRLLGYEEAEVIGLPGSIVFTPEDLRRGEPEIELREAINKGLIEIKRWHRGKDGMCFWANSSLTTLRNDEGEITGFIKVLREETSQGHLDKETSRFFTHTLDILCIVSIDGHLKRVNPAFIRALDLTDGEVLEETLSNEGYLVTTIFDLIHPDDRALAEAEFKQLAIGKPINNLENRFRLKGGSYKWLAWTFFPDLEEGLAYGVGRDITEHKDQRVKGDK
ncbi:MAG: PAS domain-containing protein [Acidobacteria bacterium]|nr:PAS domain-containing protein [Acidobacteriota bacterium]